MKVYTYTFGCKEVEEGIRVKYNGRFLEGCILDKTVFLSRDLADRAYSDMLLSNFHLVPHRKYPEYSKLLALNDTRYFSEVMIIAPELTSSVGRIVNETMEPCVYNYEALKSEVITRVDSTGKIPYRCPICGRKLLKPTDTGYLEWCQQIGVNPASESLLHLASQEHKNFEVRRLKDQVRDWGILHVKIGNKVNILTHDADGLYHRLSIDVPKDGSVPIINYDENGIYGSVCYL